MNWRVVRASARLDWQRSRRGTRIGVALIALGSGLAMVLEGGAGLLGVLIALGGFGGVAGTAMTALMERVSGRVAWWRTLPASPQDLMLGRLLAVALRGGLAALALLSVIPLVIRAGAVLPPPAALAAGFVLAGLLIATVMVLMTAIGLRYRLERVMGGLFVIFYGFSLFVEDGIESMIESRALGFAAQVFTMLEGRGAILLFVLATALLAAAILIGVKISCRAIALAEERTVTGAVPDKPLIRWRGLRYPAPIRSVALATMMLQLRLVAERLPQQVLVLVGGALVLRFLPESLRLFVAMYLPIVAFSVAGQLAFRTGTARREGSLEGWATLPVRRELVVLGTVGAAAALALLATVLMVMVRVAAGSPTSWILALGIWGTITGATSLGNGMAAWFKPVHAFVVGLVAATLFFVVVVAVAAQMMVDGAHIGLAALPPVMSLMTGLGGLLLIAPLGGALYGRGLERYERVRK